MTRLFNPQSKVNSKKTILACIDGSNVTTSVCDYALWLAEHLHLTTSLLHVIDTPKSNRHDLSGAIGMDSRKHLMHELSLLDEQNARLANKHGEALLKDAKYHLLSKSDDIEVHTFLRRSKLMSAITHFIPSTQAIIIGRRGTDHQNDRVNIGSQIENVVRGIQRPILVCSDDFESPTSYMLAFDNSPTANKAVDIICNNKIAKNLTGYIVSVGKDDAKNAKALQSAHQKMQNAGFSVTAHVIDPIAASADASSNNTKSNSRNHIVTALTEFRKQNNISLFVIGAYGHSKLRQFFVGSTTTTLLANTTAPVLLLR